MKNESFRKIVSTKRIKIGKNESSRVLINKNKMLSEYNGGSGVKTGYTKKCGRCLVSSANRNGFELICVVLNCAPMFERSKELLDNAYSKYDNYLLASADNSVGEVVSKKGEVLPVYVERDLYYPLTKSEQQKLKKQLKPYDSKQILNEFGQCCGTIEFFIENHLLFCEKIYTILE